MEAGVAVLRSWSGGFVETTGRQWLRMQAMLSPSNSDEVNVGLHGIRPGEWNAALARRARDLTNPCPLHRQV